MFKNLQLFRFTPATLKLSDLEDGLAASRFVPCSGLDQVKTGWIAPADGEHALSRIVQGHALTRLCVEKKKVPGALVKRLLRQEEARFERQNGFKAGRKQVREMKEQIVDTLLPKAFPTQDHLPVWIDSRNGWIGVDTGGYGGAEVAAQKLTMSLPDLDLALPRTGRSPSDCMREWLLSGEAPAGFTIDRDCTLQSPADDRPSVRYARHDLDSEEIRDHLHAGKLPVCLALTWNDKLSFTLTGKGEVKGVHFLDAGEDGDDDSFDARFLVMAEGFAEFVPDLMEALGGTD